MDNKKDKLKIIGDNIRTCRKAKGLTQPQLADKVGIAKNTLLGYEQGNREAKIEVLAKIALALEVDVTVLLPTDLIFSETIQDLYTVDNMNIESIISNIRTYADTYINSTVDINKDDVKDIVNESMKTLESKLEHIKLIKRIKELEKLQDIKLGDVNINNKRNK